MKFSHRILLVLTVFTLTTIFTLPLAQAMPSYMIFDLNEITDETEGSWEQATAINNHGQVAGNYYYYYSHIQHAVLWDKGTLTFLDSDVFVWVTDMNDRGQVVSNSEWADTFTGAFWADGEVIRIPSFLGLTTYPMEQSKASGINEHGQVVGSAWIGPVSWDAPRLFHAFIWENGEMTDLGTLGGDRSHANDINDFGEVVGWSQTESGSQNAFIWKDGSMAALGTSLGGASRINNRGQILAGSFLWENGTLTELGFGGHDLNELGQVVGGEFLWTKEEGLLNLNDLIPPDSGWEITRANAINDLSQIVGQGYVDPHGDGTYEGWHSFLMTPNPFPNRGTFGTEFTIVGEDFGNFRGKVYLGDKRCLVLAWSDTSIRCSLPPLLDALTPNTYDLRIIPRWPLGTDPIVMEEAFTVREPMIVNVEPSSSSAWKDVAIKGYFFSGNEWLAGVKVYLGERRCGVKSCSMDDKTGESKIVFRVPLFLPPGDYDVTVKNNVGSDTKIEGFTIE